VKVEIPRPIVKWAGGKRWSVPAILDALPPMIETYYEPFVGGGAVFFALARAGRFKHAVISDSNPELIAAYRAIRGDVEGVIRAIGKFGPSRVYAEKYNRIRTSKPRTEAGKAARFLFLNKCGFNGLYRVNLRGEFNVPYGSARKWAPDSANLRIVSMLLRGMLEITTSTGTSIYPTVELHCRDFAAGARQLELFSWVQRDDAVYFDPPYLPESKTARFSAYTPGGFSLDDHRRLGELFAKLASQGVHVVASNAAVRGAERIYEDIPGTELFELACPRAINSNGKRRGKLAELLIVNAGKPRGSEQ
jgi:DNA adenine methylase